MKKLILTVAAILATSSVFASEPLTINLNNVPSKTQTKKTEGPAFSKTSFLALPVASNNGQAFGMELAVLVDKHDEHIAIIRPLGKYKVAGLPVKSVSATSFSNDGKQIYTGLGAMVEVGGLVPGFEAELGVVAQGLNLEGLEMTKKFIPAAKFKIEPTTLVREAIGTPQRTETALRRAVVNAFNFINHAL